MGQKKIIIELTEYQALVVLWALNRADAFTPGAERQRELGKTIFYRKFGEALKIVQTATEGLSERFAPVTNLSYRKSATQLPNQNRHIGRFR